MAKRAQGAVSPAPQTTGVLRREIIRSSTFASIYSNDIQVQVSPWDVRLLLGELGEISPGPPPAVNIKELAEVRISPQLAKQLIMIMLQQLKSYEEQFGEIPTPKS